MKVYGVKRTPISKIHDYGKTTEDGIIIVVKDDKDSSVWLPSAFTHLIRHLHNDASINTKRKTAYSLCNFLNHINYHANLETDPLFKDLKMGGLEKLNFHHLEHYLNHISTKQRVVKNKFTLKEDVKLLDFQTVKKTENTLLLFYEFLYKLNITGPDTEIQRVTKETKNGTISTLISPFDHDPNYFIDYPPTDKKNSNVLKDMDEDVWNLFLDYAFKYHKNIALGVAFQMMGGLRLGEVVNLTHDAVEVFEDENYMSLSIDDRQKQLFLYRGINTEYSQVKKTRENQPVFNFNGKLFEYWKSHMEFLKKRKSSDNHNALFINSYGDLMTGEVYQKEFAKLKFNFLKEFLEKEYPSLFTELASKTWGTHIGRHVFTNHLIKKGYVNNPHTGEVDTKLLMILRGDSSEKSSATYIDVQTVTQTVASAIDIVSVIASQTKSRYKLKEAS